MERLADGRQLAGTKLPQTSQPHQAQGKGFVVCFPLLKSYPPLGWLEPVLGRSEHNPHVQASYIIVSSPSFPAGRRGGIRGSR